jgi:hypothetical protein
LVFESITGDEDSILRQPDALEKLPLMGIDRVGGFAGGAIEAGHQDDVEVRLHLLMDDICSVCETLQPSAIASHDGVA